MNNRPCQLEDLLFEVPESLVAHEPATERAASRMLVVDRRSNTLLDQTVGQLQSFLYAGDLLILNDTQVVPAKLRVQRPTGGKLDGLFLREEEPGIWRVMLNHARRIKPGDVLQFLIPTDHKPDHTCSMPQARVIQRTSEGDWLLAMTTLPAQNNGMATLAPGAATLELLRQVGSVPLPPYIHRDDQASPQDVERYQTVYAAKPGAVAAPTAGLHITQPLLTSLADSGVQHAFVTLHVGAGTFRPIRASNLAEHDMHEEWYDMPASTAQAIARCREQGGRVIAVGTTSLRVLESTACENQPRQVVAGCGSTKLFIYPPYDFRVVDALFTNFHWPGSTLMALVMAFAGIDTIKGAYAHAIRSGYRFYSYGDAMLMI